MPSRLEHPGLGPPAADLEGADPIGALQGDLAWFASIEEAPLVDQVLPQKPVRRMDFMYCFGRIASVSTLDRAIGTITECSVLKASITAFLRFPAHPGAH